jgi:hypothetical protein
MIAFVVRRALCATCIVGIYVFAEFLLLSRTVELQVVGRGVGESQEFRHKDSAKLNIMNTSSAWHTQNNTLFLQPSPTQVGWKQRQGEKGAQVKLRNDTSRFSRASTEARRESNEVANCFLEVQKANTVFKA